MTMTWTNEGADNLGGLCVGKNTTAPVVKMGLFCDPHTPSYSDVYATIAASYGECTDASYSRITLTGATWAELATFPQSGVSKWGYAQQTFTFAGGGGQTVYGYFLVLTEGAANYLWGGEFISPTYAIPGGGGSLLLTPTVEIGQFSNMPL